MSDAEQALSPEPDADGSNNGAVRVVVDISDPVTSIGIRTDRVSVEAEGSWVSPELADHLHREMLLDVEDHGIEVFD